MYKYFSLLFLLCIFTKLFSIQTKEIKFLDSEYIYEISDVKNNDKYIYIAQRGAGTIAVLDSLGNFIKYIGRKGKGPGEFVTVNDIELFDDYIIAKDNNAHRISIFNSEGNFINSFRIEMAADDMIIINDFLYISSIFSFDENNNRIHIYDLKGNEKQSLFANNYSGKNVTKAIFNNACKMININKKLYCFNLFERKIFVYNLKDTSQKEQLIIWDKKFKADIPKNKTSFEFDPAFYDIKSVGDTIFCLYIEKDKGTYLVKFSKDLKIIESNFIKDEFYVSLIIMNRKILLISDDLKLVEICN